MSSELLSIPLKTSYEVVLVEPLKLCFKDASYSIKDTALIAAIEEFQRFRNQVVSKTLPKAPASLELLYRWVVSVSCQYYSLVLYSFNSPLIN